MSWLARVEPVADGTIDIVHGTASRFAVLLFLAAIAAGAAGGCQPGPPVTAASGELMSACAITLGGRIHCWYAGRKFWVHGIIDATTLAVHETRGCAIRAGGLVTCWRFDISGLEALATKDVKLDAPTRIAMTDRLACAMVAGGVSCFNTEAGVARNSVYAPERSPGLDDAVDLAAGLENAFALRRGGAVVQLPLGEHPRPDATIPAAVQIAAGDLYGCARTEAGAVWCWGSNWMGALGDGTLEDHGPRRVVSLPPAVEIAGGRAHACARHVGGDVSCWGSNQFGQIGVRSSGLSDARRTPVRVPGVTAEALVATDEGTCAITTKHELVCWGNGEASGPSRMRLSAP